MLRLPESPMARVGVATLITAGIIPSIMWFVGERPHIQSSSEIIDRASVSSRHILGAMTVQGQLQTAYLSPVTTKVPGTTGGSRLAKFIESKANPSKTVTIGSTCLSGELNPESIKLDSDNTLTADTTDGTVLRFTADLVPADSVTAKTARENGCELQDGVRVSISDMPTQIGATGMSFYRNDTYHGFVTLGD